MKFFKLYATRDTTAKNFQEIKCSSITYKRFWLWEDDPIRPVECTCQIPGQFEVCGLILTHRNCCRSETYPLIIYYNYVNAKFCKVYIWSLDKLLTCHNYIYVCVCHVLCCDPLLCWTWGRWTLITVIMARAFHCKFPANTSRLQVPSVRYDNFTLKS